MRLLGLLSGLLIGTALAGSMPCGPTDAAVTESQPGLVEDGTYPNADIIFAETGIRLLRGDGHIELAPCEGDLSRLVRVQRRGGDDVCFRVSGAQGFLSLELPGVYLIRSDDLHTVTATSTAGGVTQQTSGAPTRWFAVGEGTSETSEPATLVEIWAES
jgi:hypothetical protein